MLLPFYINFSTLIFGCWSDIGARPIYWYANWWSISALPSLGRSWEPPSPIIPKLTLKELQKLNFSSDFLC